LRIRHGKSDDVIEIIVRDYSGRKLFKYKSNINDKKRINMIFQTLEAKHNISIPRQKDIFEY